MMVSGLAHGATGSPRKEFVASTTLAVNRTHLAVPGERSCRVLLPLLLQLLPPAGPNSPRASPGRARWFPRRSGRAADAGATAGPASTPPSNHPLPAWQRASLVIGGASAPPRRPAAMVSNHRGSHDALVGWTAAGQWRRPSSASRSTDTLPRDMDRNAPMGCWWIGG